MDMIFTAWQLQEKCEEQHLGLYQCFINLTKVFDTVNREALRKILLKLGCPEKFTSLIRSMHDNMKAWIYVSGEFLDPISVEAGVKQDGLTSTLL